MRKYLFYSLEADDGQVDEVYYTYKEAYRDYCKEVKYGHNATLYGIKFDGNISVISSHE